MQAAKRQNAGQVKAEGHILNKQAVGMKGQRAHGDKKGSYPNLLAHRVEYT